MVNSRILGAKLMTILALVTTSFQIAATEISLEEAIRSAKSNDPWLQGSLLKQAALKDRSMAASRLPDPKVSLGLSNFPTDSWHIDQEGMTQLKLGVSQQLSRGDTLAIKQQQLLIAANRQPLLRAERQAQIESQVTELWLDAYLAQKTISLIKEDWALFEQIADIAQASYANVVAKTKQQDVIRAQLELIQLKDRLTVQQQNFDIALARLLQWLPSNLNQTVNKASNAQAFSISTALPKLSLKDRQLQLNQPLSVNRLVKKLELHPAVQAVVAKQKVAKQGVALAKEQYKPQWGLNASYGYRDDMPNGESRSDLFSIGVTLDVPLFTQNKQDRTLSASIADTEAIHTEKLLLLNQMISAINKEVAQLHGLSERQAIYRQQLIRQTHDQAEAALTAYTHDTGDFSEVVRARIAELNARIASLKIDIDALKAIARLNYYFASVPKNSVTHQGVR